MMGKLRCAVGLLSQVRSNEEATEVLSRQVKTIILSAMNILMQYPLVFVRALSDYLELLQAVLFHFSSYKDENLLKSALLGLLRVAKIHAYYATPE